MRAVGAEATNAVPAARRPRILVVDDSRSVRELLRIHLSVAGYEVVCAEDAIEAGREILRAVPDLMITEISMPYMSGSELVAAVKADHSIPHFPVVFLSARYDADDHADRLRAVACLQKPIAADRLLEIVALHAGEGVAQALPISRT